MLLKKNPRVVHIFWRDTHTLLEGDPDQKNEPFGKPDFPSKMTKMSVIF